MEVLVREEGFEPSRVTPRDPKSRASASSATLASDTSVSGRHFRFNEEPRGFKTDLPREFLGPGRRKQTHTVRRDFPFCPNTKGVPMRTPRPAPALAATLLALFAAIPAYAVSNRIFMSTNGNN